MSHKDPLSHYLHHYAEKPSAGIANQLPLTVNWHHCVVIPAYNENDSFLKRLCQQPPTTLPWLIILVINQPVSDEDVSTNLLLWQTLKTFEQPLVQHDEYQLVASGNTYVLAINHFTQQRLPDKQGVGLARKIGCDIACHFIHSKQLLSQWIHTTDADSHLPDDYFDNLPHQTGISALTYAFQHIDGDDPIINQATQLYEQSLNHYVNGLRAAGSRYSFHTIGSCIVVNAVYYAQVRGFPKRAGGEDFYLLNKLAKLGKVSNKVGRSVKIEARYSHRAPFGTGIAVSKIIEQGYCRKNYPVYNPEVFARLKQLLKSFQDFFNHKTEPQQWLRKLDPYTIDALHTINIESLFKHLQQHATHPQQCLDHIHHWFDAFKTLKFIHGLEKHFPKVPIDKADNHR